MKLVLGLLALVCIFTLSCRSSSTSTSVPAQNFTGTPIQAIELSSARMIALKTVSFTLAHEDGASTELFPGIQMDRIEGRVQLPDSFDISVDGTFALTGGLGSYVNIGLVVVADQAFMSNPLTGEWNPIRLSPRPIVADQICFPFPLNLGNFNFSTGNVCYPSLLEPNPVPLITLPFSFVDLGQTLGDLIGSVQEPAFSGTNEVDGVLSSRVKGTVRSESLGTLIPPAFPGQEVDVELWIGQPQSFLRRVRIEGRILAADDPEVVRVLSIQGFDQPVEISLP